MINSGIPWIGEIPEGWKVISFSNGILRMGTGLNPRDNFELSKDADLYYVTIRNFKDGKLYLDSNCDRITPEAWKMIQERSQLRKGDILYASISKDGQAYLLEDDATTWNINESVFCIRVNNSYFNNKYFYYHLIDAEFYKDLRIDATGTTFQSIKQNKLRMSSLCLPPLSEQEAIADFLDKKCAEIDQMVALQEKFIDELKAYKQSLITETVTKGLNPNAPMKDSGVEWIGEIPEGWEIKRLRYLCKFETGNQDTQDAKPEGAYPFYVRSPLVERSDKYSFEGESILMAGDGAGAGRVFHHVYGKYAVHQRVYRLSNFSDVESTYLYYYISSLFQRVMDMGSAQSTVPSVRLPMLTNFVVCIPPVLEQQKNVSFLDKKCSEIDQLITIKQKKIEEYKDYKKSLIYEYVTGKKEVI